MTEAIPTAVTALLAVVLQPVIGVAPLPAAFSNFVSPVFFFVMVMFVIAQAFTNAGLDRRFACWLLARANGSARRTVLLIMVGTGALSTVVSDVPCAAVFMAVAIGLFDKMGLVRGQSRFAKAVMIGIPIASLIGGIGTPAGSSVNVLGLSFIERYGNVRVPFVHWMAIGIPMVVILVPFAAQVILWFYPPEQERIEGIDFRAELEGMGPLTSAEWKVITLMSAMLTLWIASSWIREIDVVIVAILGAAAMFLPGMRLFHSWKQAERGTAWDTLLMIGSVTSLGVVSASSGLAKWLVDGTLGGMETWPTAAVTGGSKRVHRRRTPAGPGQPGDHRRHGPAHRAPGDINRAQPRALRASGRLHRIVCVPAATRRRAARDLRQGVLPHVRHVPTRRRNQRGLGGPADRTAARAWPDTRAALGSRFWGF